MIIIYKSGYAYTNSRFIQVGIELYKLLIYTIGSSIIQILSESFALTCKLSQTIYNYVI